MRTHVVRILSLDTFYLKNRVLRQKKNLLFRNIVHKHMVAQRVQNNGDD